MILEKKKGGGGRKRYTWTFFEKMEGLKKKTKTK